MEMDGIVCKMQIIKKYMFAKRENCSKRNKGRKFSSVYRDVVTELSAKGGPPSSSPPPPPPATTVREVRGTGAGAPHRRSQPAADRADADSRERTPAAVAAAAEEAGAAAAAVDETARAGEPGATKDMAMANARTAAARLAQRCAVCCVRARTETGERKERLRSAKRKIVKNSQNCVKVRSWRTSFSARRAPPYPILFGVGCACGRGVSSPLHPHRSSQPPTLPSFSSLRRKARPPAQRQRPPTRAAPVRNIRARKRPF
jgi:hypothetical protein